MHTLSGSLDQSSYQQSQQLDLPNESRRRRIWIWITTSPQRAKSWAKRPNDTPNGILIPTLLLLITTCFGTVLGLKVYFDRAIHQICLVGVEGRNDNRGNFLDWYMTLNLAVEDSEQAAPIIDGLVDRMNERTPARTAEEC